MWAPPEEVVCHLGSHFKSTPVKLSVRLGPQVEDAGLYLGGRSPYLKAGPVVVPGCKYAGRSLCWKFLNKIHVKNGERA